jgi:exonuclease VII large subunit
MSLPPPSVPAPLKRVGSERMVRIEGVNGIFTPIGSAAELPIGGDERANLQAVIDALKQELSHVQSQQLQAEQQLSQLRERPSAPDDFASAVQQSLDELQGRMATMRNPMSNFAVREFKLEASVFVQVSALGNIEYRFVQPGDPVEPAALSKLTLDVVPVPKSNLAGVWSTELFQPELALADLPGLTNEQLKRLEGAGLFSIGEFLQVGTRARAQVTLQALLGAERQQLQRWAQQAALMCLRGVNGAAALVLIEAGFGNFELLAGHAPETVARGYARVRAAHKEWGAPLAGIAWARQWVRAARQYLGLPEDAPADR